jgi:nucleoside-diphosphate-sugar epimerase
MQTLLGAGGTIGRVAAQALRSYTSEIRLVSRTPKQVNPGDVLFSADLLQAQQVRKAVEGSEIVYLTAGLPYKASTWREQWPVVMRNVLDACKAADAKLVFFDNVYLYGAVDGVMTESTMTRPSSKKGKVRAQIAQMLMEEVEKGKLNALIARSADFYGPDTPFSFVNSTVFENLAKGKKPQWMGKASFRHSFTYTPDAGKAMVQLGNAPEAYNQVWHLPTAPALSGEAFVKLAAEAFGASPAFSSLSKGMLRLVGLFVPIVGESVEMFYQSERDYLFDSSKFERQFPHMPPTSYAEGIAETARYYQEWAKAQKK